MGRTFVGCKLKCCLSDVTTTKRPLASSNLWTRAVVLFNSGLAFNPWISTKPSHPSGTGCKNLS